MQAEERFGLNADPDGDGFTNELTVADLTAVSLFQATLSVPGRVIPNDPAAEQANLQSPHASHLQQKKLQSSRAQTYP